MHSRAHTLTERLKLKYSPETLTHRMPPCRLLRASLTLRYPRGTPTPPRAFMRNLSYIQFLASFEGIIK